MEKNMDLILTLKVKSSIHLFYCFITLPLSSSSSSSYHFDTLKKSKIGLTSTRSDPFILGTLTGSRRFYCDLLDLNAFSLAVLRSDVATEELALPATPSRLLRSAGLGSPKAARRVAFCRRQRVPVSAAAVDALHACALHSELEFVRLRVRAENRGCGARATRDEAVTGRRDSSARSQVDEDYFPGDAAAGAHPVVRGPDRSGSVSERRPAGRRRGECSLRRHHNFSVTSDPSRNRKRRLELNQAHFLAVFFTV